MQVNHKVHTRYDASTGPKRQREMGVIRAITQVVPNYSSLDEFQAQVVRPALILAGRSGRADFDRYAARFTRTLARAGFIK